MEDPSPLPGTRNISGDYCLQVGFNENDDLPGTRNISGDYCPTRVPAGGVKLNVPAETPGFF